MTDEEKRKTLSSSLSMISKEDFYEICNLCIDKLNIEGFRKI